MEMKKEYFQWDVNQYIPIKDKYCDFVVNGEVWRLEAENEKVRIPDECFQTHGFKIAYICYEDGTKFAFGFYVKERPAPPEYAYTESEKITFQLLVDEVNELIDDLTSKTENGYFDGKDYVLTEADKEYIASLVHVEGSENYEELRNDLTELDNTVERLSNEIVTEIDEATDLTRLAYDIPGDEIEIPSMEDLNNVSKIVDEIDNSKLEKPSNAPEVGKVLAVKSVNEDGTMVVEWADAPSGGVEDVRIDGTSIVGENGVVNMPFANSEVYGILKLGSGIYRRSTGEVTVDHAKNADITARSSTGRVIGPNNLDYAVKSAMCDGKGTSWTAEEQQRAQERIGIFSVEEVEF